MKLSILAALLITLGTTTTWAKSESDSYLVKMKPGASITGLQTKSVGLNWVRVDAPKGISTFSIQSLRNMPGVEYVQPNYKIKLMHDFRANNAKALKELANIREISPNAGDSKVDNPEIPLQHSDGVGVDPLYSSQWGMQDVGAKDTWNVKIQKPMIVAVIDTGIDYTHEDLGGVLWRNPGEMGTDAKGANRATNGVDDDGNGYVDDIVGYDFASMDNKPFDLTVDAMQLLTGGGNPGHGTHCAGNVGARSENGKGVIGVAKKVKIMGLRFLTEKGQGSTDGAILAIKYAVDNGARILSNSWGSEGEEPGDPANQALRDVIKYAQDKGVLFIAAAGNGHQGVGYDNDSDPKPSYPASYDHDNIISVAAVDVNSALGKFSNWGIRSVDIGAPGVKVFSTVPSDKYQDTIELIWNGIDLGKLIGAAPTWDGTSMATPHVAGAAAVYWGAHPEKTWQEVKAAIMDTAVKVPQLSGRVVSGGKLNVRALMTNPNWN